MGLHQERTHPEFVPGCDLCRWSSVGLSAMATPTRRPSVPYETQREERLVRDLREYKTLRQQGYQPPQVGGSSERARTARSRSELETPHFSKRKGKALRTVADRRSERVT